MPPSHEQELHTELVELLDRLQELMDEVREAVDDGLGDNGDRG